MQDEVPIQVSKDREFELMELDKKMDELFEPFRKLYYSECEKALMDCMIHGRGAVKVEMDGLNMKVTIQQHSNIWGEDEPTPTL